MLVYIPLFCLQKVLASENGGVGESVLNNLSLQKNCKTKPNAGIRRRYKRSLLQGQTTPALP